MRSIAQLCDDSIQLQEQEVKYIVHEKDKELYMTVYGKYKVQEESI